MDELVAQTLCVGCTWLTRRALHAVCTASVWWVGTIIGLVFVTSRGADIGSQKMIGRELQDQAGVCIHFSARSTVAGPMLMRVGIPMMERTERSSPQAKVRRTGSWVVILKYGVVNTITTGVSRYSGEDGVDPNGTSKRDWAVVSVLAIKHGLDMIWIALAVINHDTEFVSVVVIAPVSTMKSRVF